MASSDGVIGLRPRLAGVAGFLDRFLLPLVMEYSQAKMQQAARLLGIARQTLRLKLRELGLQVTRSLEADEDGQP